MGSRHIYRKSPLAFARGERAVRSSPVFLYDPRASFSLGRRGCFAKAPLSASRGREVSAKLQEEPPSLCAEQVVRQGFPWLFVRPSRFLFARKEGLFCRAPLSASRGRRVSAYLQEEPPSLYIG